MEKEENKDNNPSDVGRPVGNVARIHRKARFSDPFEIVHKRNDLLDSLRARKRKFITSSFINLNQNKRNKNERLCETGTGHLCERIKSSNTDDIRSKSRAFLENALNQGVIISGAELHDHDQLRAYPALLASQLEAEVYKKYSHNMRDYKGKALSLKHNLVDLKNPTLSGRVLLQEISSVNLVSVSPEDLANEKKRNERAKAVQESLKEVVLTTGDDTSVQKSNTFKGQTISTKFGTTILQEGNKKKPTTDQKKILNVTKVVRKGSVSIGKSPIKTPQLLPKSKNEKQTNSNTSDFSVESSLVSEKSSNEAFAGEKNNLITGLNLDTPKKIPTVASIGKLIRQSSNTSIGATAQYNDRFSESSNFSIEKQTGRYSPPPSPAFSVMSTYSTAGASSSRSKIVKLKGGSDMITFNIRKCSSIRFEARLVIDVQTLFSLDNVIPPLLKDKGAVEIGQFEKWVYEKTTKSGWKKISLRLSFSHTTPENQLEYKKFYKKYESDHRIAMLEVDKETKLFIVTPKYLASKCLKNLISKMDRSHAIVLTNKNLPTIRENQGGYSMPKTIQNPAVSSGWGTGPLQSNSSRPEVKGWGDTPTTNSSIQNVFVNTFPRNEFTPEPDMMNDHLNRWENNHVNSFEGNRFHGSSANFQNSNENMPIANSMSRRASQFQNEPRFDHTNSAIKDQSSYNTRYQGMASNVQNSSWETSGFNSRNGDRENSSSFNAYYQDRTRRSDVRNYSMSNHRSDEAEDYSSSNAQYQDRTSSSNAQNLSWGNSRFNNRNDNREGHGHSSFSAQYQDSTARSNAWDNPRSSSGRFGWGNTRSN